MRKIPYNHNLAFSVNGWLAFVITIASDPFTHLWGQERFEANLPGDNYMVPHECALFERNQDLWFAHRDEIFEGIDMTLSMLETLRASYLENQGAK